MMDFSAVTEIDLSSIQIIISFCKTAMKKCKYHLFGPIKKMLKNISRTAIFEKKQQNESIMFPFFENKGVKIEIADQIKQTFIDETEELLGDLEGCFGS
jgi:hypothetical protein